MTALAFDMDAAAGFLKMLDPSTDTFDFRAFHTALPARKLRGTLAQRAGELQRLNSADYGIFVTINATDGEGVTKDHVTHARAVWADLDGAPLEPVTDEHPHIVVQTSPGKYHAYWLLEPADPLEAEAVNKALAPMFGADAGATDYARVLRVPGFYHTKGEPHLVKVIHSLEDEPRLTLQELRTRLGIPMPQPGEKNAAAPIVAGLGATSPVFDRGEVFEGIPEGGRNDSIYREACRLRALNLDFAEARVLVLAAAARCRPPLPEREALVCLDSAWKHPPGKSDGFMAPDLPAGAGAALQMKVKRLGDLSRNPQTQWVVGDWIPADTVGEVVAPSTAGKTLFTMDLAAHVALGIEWQGHYVEQGAVVFLVGEGEGGLGKRRQAWELEHGASLDEAPFYYVDAVPNMLAAGDVSSLVAALLEIHAETPIKLVVIDTRSQHTAGADENSNEVTALFIRNLIDIRQATGACVLYSHHTGHMNADRGRGASAAFANVDFSILMRPDGDGVQIKQVKSKDWRPPTPITASVKAVQLGYRNEQTLDEETSAVLAYIDLSAQVRETKTANMLRQAIEKAGTNSRDAVRTAFYELHPGEPEAKRKAFARAWKAYGDGNNHDTDPGQRDIAGQTGHVPDKSRFVPGHLGHTPIGVSRCPAGGPDISVEVGN